MQRLYIYKLHTALDIFCFAAFLVIEATEVFEVYELEEVTVSTALKKLNITKSE